MHDNIELLGNYISLGKIICKIVPSTLGDCKYISLLSLNNKYLRHRDGVVIEDEYIDDELFKNDSSFFITIYNGKAKLYCSNLGLEHCCIFYSNSLIIAPEDQFLNIESTFKILNADKKDILLSCLDKISSLENRLEYLISLFELHNPITQLPKAFGRIRAFQERGIQLLQFFDKICRENNIAYWIDYGTLLGAVRHKGYIPWDDDIDVCMMYDDFCKFQAIIDKVLQGTDIKFIDTFYPYIYKLERTSLGDEDVWLDIFPFYFQKDGIAYSDYLDKFHQARNEREKLLHDPEMLRKYSLDFNEYYDNKKKSDTIFRGFQAADHPLCDVRKYDEVFPLVELEFEGLKLFAPRGYLQKLQRQYGNFWTYPETLLSHREW